MPIGHLCWPLTSLNGHSRQHTARFPRPQERDDTLLALIGDDGELNPAGLNVEDCVSTVALPEDNLFRIQLRIRSKADNNSCQVKVRRSGNH